MKKRNHGEPRKTRRIPTVPILLLLGVLTGAILFGVGFAAWGNSRDGASFLHTETTALQSGWIDDRGNRVSLPATLPYQSSGYQLEKELSSGGDNFQCLIFSAKYLNVHLFLDGKELGSCLCRPEGQKKTSGKTFMLFRLPEGFAGGTLRLEAEPLLGENCQHEIVAPHMGAGSALVYELIADELPSLGISAVIFCFGLFLLVCGAQSLHASAMLGGIRTFQADYLHIGVFAMMFALYSIAITDTIHLFAGNSYFVYLMEFLLLSLLPIPLLALVSATCASRFRLPLLVDGCIIFLNFAVQVTLHFGWSMELRTAVPCTHLLMVVSAVLQIPALASIGLHKKGHWWLPLSFLPVLAGAFLDIFRLYLPRPYQKAVGFQLGVLLFLLLQTIDLIRKSFAYYENSLKENTYREMAYTDVLTGLLNRAAFEMKLTEIQERLDQYSAIWCVSADINNLKQINDAFGHSAGDKLIRDTAQVLQSVVDRDTPVYRIGGDEFEFFYFISQKIKSVRSTPKSMRYWRSITQCMSIA